jgi:NAD-dependent deacetylase
MGEDFGPGGAGEGAGEIKYEASDVVTIGCTAMTARERSRSAGEELAIAAETLAAARYAIALVGAGISVESGIPPFRGPGGLWTKHGEPPMDGYQRMLADPAKHWREMIARRSGDDEFVRAIREARPNDAHRALARLEVMGVLKHTISQNIDNLHFEAGSVSVTEIHGNRTKLRCIECGARWPFDEFLAMQVAAADELPHESRAIESAPACPHCGGVVKGDTVMFGEPIPQTALAECYAQAERADCILIAGTSATVMPAAWFPEIVRDRGGSLIEVNTDPTPFTRECVASLRGPAGEVLPRLVDAVSSLRAERSGA